MVWTLAGYLASNNNSTKNSERSIGSMGFQEKFTKFIQVCFVPMELCVEVIFILVSCALFSKAELRFYVEDGWLVGWFVGWLMSA